MKKQLFIIISVLLLAFPASVAAQTSTPSPTKPEPSVTANETLDKKLSEQIKNLQEKIASRVSELNLVERRGMIGVISEVSGNKITLTDIAGKTRFVDVDEITKFSSVSAKGSFGLSDLKKGTRISTLGLYNKQSKRILARFINTTVDPIFINGAISNLDSENFYATITTPDGKQIKLDVQTTTKTVTYDEDGLTKAGFSKLEIGNRVAAIGFPDKKDPNLIVANRIVVLPTLAKNPKIIISMPSPTEEITPTKAVKKVTPTQP
jgi:hypothetical protein